jgi:hypothetical protein
MKAGYHYSASPRQKRDYPSCWDKVVNESNTLQDQKFYTPSLAPTPLPEAVPTIPAGR